LSPSHDLASLLTRPEGYVPVAGDSVSGPITSRDDVARIFTDTPGQAQRVLQNGFVRGYVQSWRSPQPTTFSDPMPPTVLVMTIVLEFATDSQAATMVESFRKDGLSLGHSPFPVPDQLPHAHGDSATQRAASITTYYQGIVWTRGRLVYSVALSSSEQPMNTDTIVRLALHQDAAATRS
jgi:hypothetical protein